MKRFVGVFSILFTFCLHAQITENFTDSNFTSNPVWNGTDETDTLCNVGVYVIYVEFLYPSGKRGSEKLICSLTSM